MAKKYWHVGFIEVRSVEQKVLHRFRYATRRERDHFLDRITHTFQRPFFIVIIPVQVSDQLMLSLGACQTIRTVRQHGYTIMEISKMYNISPGTVNKVVNNKYFER